MAKKRKTKAKKKTGAKRKSGLTQTTYSLSPELQAVVGSKSLTRPQVVKKLWAYIKAHKCQDTKNRRLIVPDRKLAEVIGKKPVDMLKLAGLLSKHIK
jgi:chromatin remodeling complex protein RSC6